MVIYDLVCQSGHEFEGWFRNADELASQQESKMLTCPFCNTDAVTKKVTGSKVFKKSNSSQALQSVATNVGGGSSDEFLVDEAVSHELSKDELSKERFGKLQIMLTKVHDYVDNNFEDVGNRFAEEALSIHKGEKEATNIRGTASQSEIKELAEEGVKALPLPAKPVSKKDLN